MKGKRGTERMYSGTMTDKTAKEHVQNMCAFLVLAWPLALRRLFLRPSLCSSPARELTGREVGLSQRKTGVQVSNGGKPHVSLMSVTFFSASGRSLVSLFSLLFTLFGSGHFHP